MVSYEERYFHRIYKLVLHQHMQPTNDSDTETAAAVFATPALWNWNAILAGLNVKPKLLNYSETFAFI